MLWKKTKKMGLTNVCFECDFDLVSSAFTVRTKVLWCFLIGGTPALIIGKIRFRVTHIFLERNVCADKLVNLGFIHIHSFHWYNRLSSSLFLEFFMNKYSLSMYHFC